MNSMALEIVGYVGTLLVALSFMSKSIVKLRALNLTGALIITVYALLTKAYPIALLDGLIAIINGYHLVVLFRNARQNNTTAFKHL